MDRYDKTKIGTSKKTSKRHQIFNKYRTTLYDKIPLSNSDIHLITTDGDRLDLLAQQFYGDSTLWWYIAQANNLNTMNLEPGTSIRVPKTLKHAKGR